MRIGRVAHPIQHLLMSVTFVVALVATFFAFAPTASACESSVVIRKVETGAAAPGGTYTILMQGGEVVREIVVGAGESVTVEHVTPGHYVFQEVNAPAGATIVPSSIDVSWDMDGHVIEVVATNPYPAGKLAITKVATGSAAPGGEYVFDVDGPGGNDVVARVAAGATWTSRWLPLGTYTVTERNAPAGATIVPNPVVLTTDEATVTVTATNPYRDQFGRLAITKVETGGAAPGGTYTFDIVGTAETRASGVSMVATVAAGTTWTSDPLPLGTYTVTERNAPVGATIVPNPVVLTTDEATVTVTATNPYRDQFGRLAITKVETGGTAPGGTYTFDIVGTAETRASGVNLIATVAAGTTWTSDPLPLGTYTVTERNAPVGATIVPNPVVLTTDEATVTVTATNPYRDLRGRLAIVKVETGDTAPGGIYTFDVDGPGANDVVATVVAGSTWMSDWLPLGTYTVTERDAPIGATIVPNPVILTTDEATVTVTATNPYRDFSGTLTIRKVVTGSASLDKTFTINVAGPVSFSVDLKAGASWTSGALPLGTYTVTEVAPMSGTTIAPNPAVIDTDGENVLVTVTNPWPVGKLSITKIVSGLPDATSSHTFDVKGPENFSVTIKAGATWVSGWLPLGTYTITEVDGPTGHTIVPNPVRLNVDGVTVAVTVTNPAVLSAGGAPGGETLPATGGGLLLVPQVAAVLVATGTVMLIVRRLHRRHA